MSAIITGRQIREARTLLGFPRAKFAAKLGVPHTIVKLAEMTDGDSSITVDRAKQIRRALDKIGVEICAGDDGSSSVRLRRADLDDHFGRVMGKRARFQQTVNGLSGTLFP